MALETVVLAIGSNDADQLNTLAETTADIAGPADARIQLLYVFADAEYDDVRERLNIDPNSETTPGDVARREQFVRDVRDVFDERDVRYDVGGTVGKSGDSIVEETARADADLAIIGGNRRSPTGKAVFGSTAQEVILNSTCPVTFVRSD